MSDVVPTDNKEIATKSFSMREHSEDREAFAVEDIVLPFLTIIQDLSPQRKSVRPEYIKEALSGDIFNTVTHQLFKEVLVIPCRFQRRYVEWKPDRGGLVRDWGSDDSAYNNASEGPNFTRLTRAGNEIVSLATYYVLHINENEVTPALISMGSTQWKKARRWNALLQNFELQDDKGPYPAPIYARVFKLTSVHESNDKNDWYGWETTPLQTVSTYPNGIMLLNKARIFRKAVGEGSVTVTAPPGATDDAYDPKYGNQVDDGPTWNRDQEKIDDNIPF